MLPVMPAALIPALALTLSLGTATPTPARAEKFRTDGAALIYDTESAADPAQQEIQPEDLDTLRRLLEDTPGLTKLVLNSGGGSVWVGNEMAHVVRDYELDTEVDGECSSSCVIVFLAGATRTMTRGSKIGFHQRSWAPDAVQSYYDRWREDEGWDTPFDFGSWLYQDTQTETWAELTYMISRGVDPAFAIETKRMRANTWFPARDALTAAGVLTP